ncbi:MAG: D-aminoacylase [Desulfobacterales bacterium]|nr:D-aminoacylase [Desulfobacterales bacterium]
MLDLAIVNGVIMDGSGAPGRPGALGVEKGRIVAADGDVQNARRTIDARGLAAAPGFIDIHAHSCAALAVDPRGLSALHQGVTTHVVGNCGFSMSPPSDLTRSWLGRFGVEESWADPGEWAARIRERGVGLNMAPLVGHGVLRAGVMGEEARRPDPDEMAEMKRLLHHAMKEGAFGMSTGLAYPPGCFAEVDELVELARVAGAFGGVYASHIRNEEAGLMDAVKEAVSIGERAPAPVQISHFKAAGRLSWGLVRDALAFLDKARARGVDVAWDQYPYIAASTVLSFFLPDWAHEGGWGALQERMRGEETRRRILADMGRLDVDWRQVLIIDCPGHAPWGNRTPVEIGAELGLPPEEAVLEILLAGGGNARMVDFAMCEEDVETVMRHPVTMVGSDGMALSADGPLGDFNCHPRSYGAFSRVLGRYVREKGVLKLEDAIRKMTSAPARRLGLDDRGLLRRGARADITVFDPARVTDVATYDAPRQYATGVAHVIVNGRLVIEKGEYTGELPGEVLRKKPGPPRPARA